MKNLIKNVIFSLILLIGNSCNIYESSHSANLRIEFNLVSADSLKFMSPSVTPARQVKEGRFIEEIIKYPANFEILSTYQFDAQHNRKLSKLFVSDSSYRNEQKDKFSKSQIDFMVEHSKVKPYDCFISACEVKDETGEKFFVFDLNNDEDLSNDPLLSYKDFENQFVTQKNKSVYKMAESIVEVEIFDGEKISGKNLNLSFVKQDVGNRELNFVSNRMINAGYLVFNDKKYFSMILNRPPNINYNSYDFLWIDLNQNRKYDFDSDFYQQMLSPFTLFGSTYEVSHIDVFGNTIQIAKLNPSQYPPIDIGLPAPDFKFSLNDSSDFRLSNYKGKYVLLDFWMCSSSYCNSVSLGINNKYQDKNNFQIISCALNSISYDRFKQTQNDDESDSRIFILNNDIEVIRKLYQIGAENKLILIDPEFNIESIEKFTSKKTTELLSEVL